MRKRAPAPNSSIYLIESFHALGSKCYEQGLLLIGGPEALIGWLSELGLCK